MVDGETVAASSTSRAAVAGEASPSGPLPGWAVATIVVGSLALIALGAAVAVMIYRRAATQVTDIMVPEIGLAPHVDDEYEDGTLHIFLHVACILSQLHFFQPM